MLKKQWMKVEKIPSIFISQLEEKVKELLKKVDFSDRKITDLEIVNDLKEQQLEISKTKTEKLVSENKNLKGENKDLSTEVNIALHEKTQSAKQFENDIEMLREKLKIKVLETEEIVNEVEIERAEVKTLKDKIDIEKQSVSSQTNSHFDIPYLVTDPLPPIFSMELRYKTKPIHFLSKSIPNLDSILWCPPDDEYLDEAEEYLCQQYDREVKEFYIEAREKAF